MKNYTLTEVRKILNSKPYKYYSLTTSSNELILPFNKRGEHLEKLEDIFKFCETKGSYCILAKDTISKIAKPQIFCINNLDANITGTEVKPRTVNLDNNFNDVANHPAVKMQQEIYRLELTIERQEEQIQNLLEEIEELKFLQDEKQTLSEEEEKPSMLSNAQNFLSQIMEFGAPLLDQHFQLQKEKTEIERLKLQRNQRPTQPAPVKNNNAENIIKIENWIESKSSEENYNELLDLYNNSETLYKFKEGLKNLSATYLQELNEL